MTEHQLKAAALHCSVALGCIDAVKQLFPAKSAMHNRLTGVEQQMTRALDLVKIETFSIADLNNASQIFDLVNDEIAKLYP